MNAEPTATTPSTPGAQPKLTRRTLGVAGALGAGLAATSAMSASAQGRDKDHDKGGGRKPRPGAWEVGMRPFAANSLWNTPIAGKVKYTEIDWFARPTEAFWVNWSQYSPAIYVAKRTDPVYTITTTKDAGWTKAGTRFRVRMPADAVGAAGTDAEMIVIDGTRVCNFWQFGGLDKAKRTATTSAFAEDDVITGTGFGSVRQRRAAGTTGAGSSLLAGLLVEEEFRRGEIEHAIHLALDVDYNMPSPLEQALYPAIQADGWAGIGVTREGEHYAIPPTTEAPTFHSEIGAKMFRAMKTYGAFNVDSAADCTIVRAQANAWDLPTLLDLEKDLKVIVPMLQRVHFFGPA